MSEVKWTNEQLLAINEKGTDLLVSAAAGSGKTAVLTERIIRRLTDTENPVDVTDFLIVTFTVLATAELREKLNKAIKKASLEKGNAKILKRQLINLPNAKILTIDSFCKFIVTESAKKLQIPADFKLGEENELNQITSQVISETLDAYFEGYEGDKIADTSFLPKEIKTGFLRLADCFSSQKTFDSLNETIVKMYNKLMKYPDPMLRAQAYLTEYEKMLRGYFQNEEKASFFDSKLGSFITAEIRESISVTLKYLEEAEKLLVGFDEMSGKYAPAVQDDIAQLTRALSSDDKDLVGALAKIKFTKLAGYSAKDPVIEEVKKNFQDIRNAGKKIIAELAKKYPLCSEEALFLQIADTYAIANELFSVVREFSNRLMREKLERKIFSFDDIAQFAYKALIKEGTYNKETGELEKTDYAIELSEKFHEILIDEYQDVNELQDAIFRAISNSHNRFMVGDLKQSIYKFRGATPEIFFKYRNTFEDISSKSGEPRIVALQNNFRSDSSVINFVNHLFDTVMNYRSDEVYKKTDYLTFSKDSDEKTATEISVFQNDEEYEYIADRILEGVNNSSHTFGDYCIIARKHDALAKAQKVLSSRGIPSDYTPSENFFNSYEIRTVHSLLKAIDNPSDDVPLISALTSPVFGFTPSELLVIRESSKPSDMYFALRDYQGNTELQAKCEKVIKKLKYWRSKASAVPVSAFIWQLYAETHLKFFVQKLSGGKERLNNLIIFYSLARKFESSEFKGLTKFLAHLEAYMNSTQKLKAKDSDKNSVHLMTIHDSKGLEFPVCFYASSASPVSREDEKKKIKISETFGPAFTIPVGSLGGRLTTYAEKAAIAETRADNIDEELRLLYVALTRAKNSLIITASLTRTEIDKFVKDIELCSICKTVFSHSVKNATNMFKIISLGMYSHPAFKEAINSYNGENISYATNELKVNIFSEYNSSMLMNTPKKEEQTSLSQALSKEDIEFALSEPYSPLLSKTPYKISVSAIREGLLDEGETASISRVKKYPSFASLDSDNISAFTGTAMHVFMQFCDFENCVKEGTVAEAEKLVKEAFITEEQKNVLNHLSLTAFFNSGTYKEIKASKRVEREKRYTLLLPSSSFYNDPNIKSELDRLEKKTLIQGVIDCYYINGDGTITLIDFKTDSVGIKDGEEKLRERHRHQIRLYRQAIEQIEEKKVTKAIVYSFSLSKEIEIN